MSFRYMQLVIEHSQTKGVDRAIMLVLAYRANDIGTCWPSLKKIAEDSGFSRCVVARHLRSILRTGELHRERRRRAGCKEYDSTVYTLTLKLPPRGSGQIPPLDKVDGDRHHPSSGQIPQVVADSTQGSSGQILESSEKGKNEPSMNRQKKTADLTDHRIDYEKANPPKIEDYADIHGCSDPILAAIAVTGERSKKGWGHWVKVLNGARNECGSERAERLFRGCLTELWGEMKQGECRKPGALLNVKLKKVFT